MSSLPRSQADRASPEDCEVTFEPSALVARVAAGTSLLEAARSVGLPVASACGADGVCARCGMQVLSGADTLEVETEREREIKRRNRVDPSSRLACRVTITGSLTVTAAYWG